MNELKETGELMDTVVALSDLGVALSDGFQMGDAGEAITAATSAMSGVKGITEIPNELQSVSDEGRKAFVEKYAKKLSDSLSIEEKKQVVADLLDSVVLITRSVFNILQQRPKGLAEFDAKEFVFGD